MKVRHYHVGGGMIEAHNMPCGRIGIDGEGEYILSTYDGYVSLNDPSKTWENDCTIMVHMLPVGTKVTLTIDQED